MLSSGWFSDVTPPYLWPLKGYDVPTDAQLAVDLAALGMLSLLLQLFGVGEASSLLVRAWQTLKVKLVDLDGHPATRVGEGWRSTYRYKFLLI